MLKEKERKKDFVKASSTNFLQKKSKIRCINSEVRTKS